jgi:hypothetical protein
MVLLRKRKIQAVTVLQRFVRGWIARKVFRVGKFEYARFL